MFTGYTLSNVRVSFLLQAKFEHKERGSENYMRSWFRV